MTCNDFQEQISTYIDSELEPAGESTLFSHLGTCAACRGFLKDAVQLRADLQSQAAVAQPAALDRRVSRSMIRLGAQAQREVWTATAGAFARRISVRVAGIAVALAILSSVILTSLWYRAEPSTATVVYLPALSAVQVTPH